VAGLENRRELLVQVASAGADALIATYGTLRDCGDVLAGCSKIMKLDLATLSVGAYRDSELRIGWTLEDAARVGADSVLTYVQLGTAGELDALTGAARTAAAADRAGLRWGHFNVGGPHCQPNHTGTCSTRHHVAAFDTRDNKLLGWNPDANSAHGVFVVTHSRRHVAFGGFFTRFGGHAQQGIAVYPRTSLP
jgi:hypothetical protein